MSNHPFMTEDQKAVIDLTTQILRKELTEDIIKEYDRKGGYPMEVAKVLYDAGPYGLNVPKKYGGMGLDFRTHAMLIEEMARIDAGFAFSFISGSVVMDLLDSYGNEKQCAYVADKLLKEHQYSCFCLTEPDAGSDAGSLRTTYKKVGNEYVLNGTKCFITNGPIGDIFIVGATKDRSLKTKGISFFLVEKKDGVKIGKEEDKMGLRLSVTSDVILDDVHIPEENLIGEEGKGFYYAMGLMDRFRPLNTSYAVGIAQAALDCATKYAQERKSFGVPIIQHQAVGFKLAEMQARIYACRAMIRMSCEMNDNGIPLGSLSSATKFFVSEECFKVADDAIQVLGGYGYMRDYPVEKYLRDMRIFSIFEGTNQICRLVVQGDLARKKF